MNIKEILDKLDTIHYTETEAFLTDMIKQAKEEKDSNTELSLLNEMIGFCRDSCQFDKTKKYAQEILQFLNRENLNGTEAYATSLLNIANAERASGDLQDSLSHYKEVYELYRKIIEPGNFLFASLNNNMSLLYQEMGDFESSCKCLEKALAIAENTPDSEIETAITHTNLAQSLLRLNKPKEALEHVNIAFGIFAKDGNRDYHYSGALSVYAEAQFMLGAYNIASMYYEKAMNEFEKHMGKGGNYNILMENRDRALEKMTEAGQTLCKTEDMVNQMPDKQKYETGLELCEAYFNEYGLPMLQTQFPQYLHEIAVGMAGEGSECFGFDDEYSKDHDWGPGFCLWITDELYEKIGDKLQVAYDNLPQEFHGYKRNTTKEGAKRTGVCTISQFHLHFMNPLIPQTKQEWLSISDEALSSVTNGKVFMDESGEFTKIRDYLKQYYPREVQQKKLAIELINMAKTGQYNFSRMLKRGDKVTAQIYLGRFMVHTLRTLFLLNGQYAPYEKWLHKGASRLPILPEITDILNAIADMPIDDSNIPGAIEIIAQLIVDELQKQKWIQDKNETDPFFLEPYGKSMLENVGKKGNEMHDELVNKIVLTEWNAFDKVKNEGGRASCQDDWNTFSIMRKSQYMEWSDEMLQSYLNDFENAAEKGWNLITEKYGRMMESTTPDHYEKIKDSLPPLDEKKKAIIEEIVKIQVGFMEELSAAYPKVAGTARSIHTSDDTPYNTSYETYLRGELGTYSDETLALYGQFIVSLVKKNDNLAKRIMSNTAALYGYQSLDELEERL